MNDNRWTVCYEVITDESAEDGDCAERGTIGEYRSFSAAFDACGPRTMWCDGGNWEASCYPLRGYAWFSRSFNEYEDGETYVVSLHPPRNISDSRIQKIAKFLGAI